MSDTLIDANVLIDVLTRNPDWYRWSSEALQEACVFGRAVINPIIYAELAPAYDDASQLEAALARLPLVRQPLPWEAGFLAGKAHQRYRRAERAQKRSPMPDFYIGAHAQVEGLTLLMRDARRYRTYFPEVRLVAPA